MIPLLSLIPTLIQAVPSLIEVFGNKKQAEVAEKVIEIAQQVTGVSNPAEAVAAIAKDPALALQFETAVMDNKLEFKKLDIEEQKIYVDDVQNARLNRDDKTFWLGVAIMITFTIVVCLVLWGGFLIIVGKAVIDSALFAAVSGTIGTIVGYVASNANQVISFFYGSSHGSMKKSDDIADSIKTFGNFKK